MSLKLLPSTPKIALNAAFLKVRPLRVDIDLFLQAILLQCLIKGVLLCTQIDQMVYVVYMG
jgi:hypothetical protein